MKGEKLYLFKSNPTTRFFEGSKQQQAYERSINQINQHNRSSVLKARLCTENTKKKNKRLSKLVTKKKKKERDTCVDKAIMEVKEDKEQLDEDCDEDIWQNCDFPIEQSETNFSDNKGL